MPRPTMDSFDTAEAVRAAIKYAQKWAGADDEAFLRALDGHFRQSMKAAAGARGLRAASAVAAPPSFHLLEDKRYLKNARQLTKRTLGGTRVLGGQPVKPNEFLDCVAVGSDAQWGCTGTLIAPNVVLTAGHCADLATRVFFGHNVAKPGKTVAVKKAQRHPKYHSGQKNDLMILLLAERVDFVEPRAIAPKALVDKATDGRVVGFGNTDPMGMFGYGIKRAADVPVASPSCSGKTDGHDDHAAYGCDRGLEIVAGRPLLERDSCKGDSGGPFYVLDQKKKWWLAGATSRATDSAMNTCGDGGIYVRVDRYRAWIESIPGVTLPKK